MAHRMIFLLVCLCFFMPSIAAQEDLVTDGSEEYWDPSEEELFQIFKGKYWMEKFRHQEALKDLPLFIRLEDDHARIAMLKRNGKTNAVNEIQSRMDRRNKELVQAIQSYFLSGNYFFYYSKDAEEIFKNSDFSYLYKDLDTKAENVNLEEAAFTYVLMYKDGYTGGAITSKRFIMHIWDYKSVKKLRNSNLVKKRLFSFAWTTDRIIKKMCSRIWTE